MSSDSRSDPLSTPCRRLCTLDAGSGLCLGCGRSLAEIAQWGLLDEPTRRSLMAELPQRLAALTVSVPPERTTA